jgi:hypothetical protein
MLIGHVVEYVLKGAAMTERRRQLLPDEALEALTNRLSKVPKNSRTMRAFKDVAETEVAHDNPSHPDFDRIMNRIRRRRQHMKQVAEYDDASNEARKLVSTYAAAASAPELRGGLGFGEFLFVRYREALAEVNRIIAEKSKKGSK